MLNIYVVFYMLCVGVSFAKAVSLVYRPVVPKGCD